MALAGVVSTGCGAGPAAGPATPVDALVCGPGVPTTPGRLPARDWMVVAICAAGPVVLGPGESAPPPAVPSILEGDLRPLLAALGRPDARPASACTLALITRPRFWLVDQGGQAFEPRVPRGPCGDQRSEVTAALATLRPR